MRPALFFAALLLCPSVAGAEIVARFTESAPKDRFEITNTGACDQGAIVLMLDLSRSAAGLIFDTTGSGAGVSVFQPFDLVAGGDLLRAVPQVTDGMNSVELRLSRFPAGATLAFTVDVDDTLVSGALGQTRVSGGEISGAQLRSGDLVGVFSQDGVARIAGEACLG